MSVWWIRVLAPTLFILTFSWVKFLTKILLYTVWRLLPLVTQRNTLNFQAWTFNYTHTHIHTHRDWQLKLLQIIIRALKKQTRSGRKNTRDGLSLTRMSREASQRRHINWDIKNKLAMCHGHLSYSGLLNIFWTLFLCLASFLFRKKRTVNPTEEQ